ncbi:MAG TPA: hypothetical protein DDZ51_12980 [Planctomycetaceae bacterium]|nr:hypothetical protein [Planctomycetaceae bacterium]
MVLASLVFSDFAAMRHVGNCCGDNRPMAGGPSKRSVGMDLCRHEGCRHAEHQHDGRERVNPFRRKMDGGSSTSRLVESDAVAGRLGHPCPCSPDHDGDQCAVCRWFVVISSGINIDLPVAITCGEWVAEPFVVALGMPARMLFLPTVSRRGPPAVA